MYIVIKEPVDEAKNFVIFLLFLKITSLSFLTNMLNFLIVTISN